MMTWEKFKKSKNGKKLIAQFNIENENDYCSFIEETLEYWHDMEQACDICAMSGMTIEEMEDIILF